VRLKGRGVIALVVILRWEDQSVPGEPIKRNLAAIFAADIAGYSQLMTGPPVCRRITGDRNVQDHLHYRELVRFRSCNS